MPVLLTATRQPREYVHVVPGAYSQSVRENMRAVPGCTWVPDPELASTGFYRLPLEAARPVLQLLRKAKIAIVDGDLLHPAEAGSSYAHGDGLKDYQRTGIGWLTARASALGGALLADDMGLGKSVQALHAAYSLMPLEMTRALIVCPAVVQPHWHEQARRWLGVDAPPIIRTGQKTAPPAEWHGLRTISYDMLRNRGPELQKIAPAFCVLPDEAHYIANGRAKRSVMLRQLLTTWREPLRIALTGTPMTTEPSSLWHVLDTITPGRWGTYGSFTRRYSAGRYEDVGAPQPVWVCDGISHPEELAERMRAVMLRRTKAELGSQLPPVTHVVLPVELPAKSRAMLSKAAAALSVCDGDSIGRLLGVVEEHKTKAACELVKDLELQGKRVLVYTTRRETCEQIAKALSCPFAHGGHDKTKRRERLLSGASHAVATMHSVTTGIDLVEFDAAIYVGLDWRPDIIMQSAARLHRLGQLRDVTLYFLIGIGTVDEVIREKVIERLDHFAKIVGAAPSDEAMTAALAGESQDLIAELAALVKASCV